MRRIILGAILVIILVCLNWFANANAQDTTAYNDARIEELRKQLSQGKAGDQSDVYRTSLELDEPDSRRSDSLINAESSDSVNANLDYQGDTPSRVMVSFDQLQPFGMDLFTDVSEGTPPSDIAAADDYLLGPGDNLVVYLWGRVEQEYELTVDRSGEVFVPKVGKVPAYGHSLSEFRDLLKERLSGVYSDFDIHVSLGKIRTIRIYLTGEVKKPGAYVVSSLTSLFNALYMAGGPNNNGSLRDIRLMRNGKQVVSVDVYKFLLEGDNSLDVRLHSGDAIFVPVAGPRVAIRGRVNREAMYELRGDETALDLLALAGNAKPDAYLDRVLLERIMDRERWEVRDLDLNGEDQKIDNVTMTDGDRVTVYSVYDMKRNMVSVAGKVQHPGYYERNASTRVADLLERARLQPYDVYYERANLYRRHSDYRTEVISLDLNKILSGDTTTNVMLQDRDSLHVYAVSEMSWEKRVYIGGEVKNPGSYNLYDNMTVEDLIFLAGSLKRGAARYQAELARFDDEGQPRVQEIDLYDMGTRQMVLRPDDRLYVRKLPQWKLRRTVTINGEVQYPGEYVLESEDETLYDLIQRAGGFTSFAFPLGLVFERPSIGKTLDARQVPQRMQSSAPLVKDSTGEVSRQFVYEYNEDQVNRVVIDMDVLLRSDGEKGDVGLEPGDKIYVPSVPTGITVLGAVSSNGTIKYHERGRVKDYIKKAGSLNRQADKKNIQLIKANGEVYAGNGTLGQKVGLGDVIVVPSRIKEKHDWSKTLTAVLTATTGLLTTVVLIDKL